MHKLQLATVLCLMFFSAFAKSDSFSQCLKFDYEEKSFYEVLIFEFNKNNIEYVTNGILCYKPKDEKKVNEIINSELPSTSLGPDYALFSERKYAEIFKKYLTENGIEVVEKKEEKGKIQLGWKGKNVMLVNSAMKDVRLAIAKDIKYRASELKN